jgi:hypothetical protein
MQISDVSHYKNKNVYGKQEKPDVKITNFRFYQIFLDI